MFNAPVDGCVFIHPDKEKALVKGSKPPRIKFLDDIPSPYLNGMLDVFFDGRLSPFIETNRGCPFKCSFCHTGSNYYQKIHMFSLERIKTELEYIAIKLTGQVSLPYPHFSSKTVQGKPLHTWTLEDRLDEIEIPTAESTIYELHLESLTSLSRTETVETALDKINTIPPVTDKRKALGNDFRRADVRQDWQSVLDNFSLPNHYQIATFMCSATSGTYMRSLSEVIAKKVGTCGLAWNIHRTKIGTYSAEHKTWTKEY